MTWAKIDDRANENPKQLRAGARACWLWACGLMYCNRQPRKTGQIPKVAIAILFPGLGMREAKQLVEVGLWHDDGDHYQVHDYHGWNPELGKVRAEAGRKGGKASSKSRGNTGSKPEAKQTANRKQVASKPEATTEASTEPRAQPRARARTAARWIHPTPPLKLEPPNPPEGGEDVDWVSVVFRAWQEDTGHTQAKLDPKRRKRIQARLDDGFSAEQLIQAIRNRRARPWLMGENPDRTVYDKLSTLLRDAEQVEGLIALSQGEATPEPIDNSPDVVVDDDYLDSLYQNPPEAQA